MFYTIDNENSISAFASAEEAAAVAATPFDSFTNEKELAELVTGWAAERLVATFNSLPGVTPVKRFKTGNVAASRIWKCIQGLGDAAKPEPEAAPAKPKANKKAKRGQGAAQGKPAKAKATRKATPAANAPKAKKAAQAKGAPGPREGSKTELVIGLLKRKGGATLAEVMEATGWLSHTTRAFVSATLGKKLGLAVESTKSDKGERTYRIK